jgi:rare lipoprotein A
LWLLSLCGVLHAQDELHSLDVPHAQEAGPVAAEPGLMALDASDAHPAPMPSAVQDAAPVTAPPPQAEAPPFDSGVASWYGPRFHGRLTASGETFDMHALTAAHPTLPFGSIVRVRSLVNDRVVDVRINDRGPYSGGRIIDLSRAAAAVLGLIQSGAGTKPVQLNLLRSEFADRSQRARRFFSARRSSPPAVR